MTKTIISIAVLLGMGYFAYDVFLAEDALVKRSTKTVNADGGYEIVTKLDDGSRLVETYEVTAEGKPKSHSLMVYGTEPGSEPRIMKKGSFIPKTE